jgi:hypothetical protein
MSEDDKKNTKKQCKECFSTYELSSFFVIKKKENKLMIWIYNF